MPSNRQPVDIEGLRSEFKKNGVSVTECLAKSFAKLQELAAEEEPSKAKEFQARIAFGMIRSAALLLKARPELAGKAAGDASMDDLLSSAVSDAGGDHSARQPLAATQQAPTPIPRLARPGDEDKYS